jgi:DNA polymerase I-like protein with 3'-5' exonuclease and polymerase domains
MIKDEMENAFKLEVPLVVDFGMGKIGWKRILE